MTIETLKKKIEDHQVEEESFVFLYKKSKFLPEQYAKEIARQKGLTIVYEESAEEGTTLFEDLEDGNLYVTIVDSFNSFPKKNHIVITKATNYADAIAFPELENWQIKDYLFSKCSGADVEILDRLLSAQKDLYSLENEICKLSVFNEQLRGALSKEFLENNVFSGVSKVDVFDFINAIQRRNFEDIGKMYLGYKKDPMSLIGLLYKQFKNMVDVYLQKNPTEENTGLKINQIYAIKKVCQNYTKQQVLDIFKFLCSLDNQLKKGELPMDNLFDYVLVKVLSI